MSQVLAQVIVDSAGHQLGDRLFSYIVPEHLTSQVKVGSQVVVPFGRMEPLNACVVTVDTVGSAVIAEYKLKEILDVLGSRQLFDKQYFEFLQAVADYYMAPLASVIAAALPPKVNLKARRMVQLQCADNADLEQRLLAPNNGDGLSAEAIDIVNALKEAPKFKLSLRNLRSKTRMSLPIFYRTLSVLKASGQVKVYSQADAPAAVRQVKTVVWAGKVAGTPRQENVIAVLKQAGGQVPLSELLEAAGTTRGTVARMEKEGIVQVVELKRVRDPLDQYGLTDQHRLTAAGLPAWPELTPDQKKVYATLDDALCAALNPHSEKSSEAGSAVQPWLIHGVTGSGKTEIYLRLIARTLTLGRSALLMVPEIALTPQLAHRLHERFSELVSVWHSGLSAGERYDTWCRLKRGEIRVLLGARSAIFADMPELGLIVLDEEHDGSYKQSTPAPRYNAQHVAAEKAGRCAAMVVLGSATPDVVSLHAARACNHLLELPRRITNRAMPAVEIVDMRLELQQGHRSEFSRRLQDEISACLGRGEQTILLMNRRGFAQHVFCKSCGFVMKCRHCSVSLVLHQNDNNNYLACHHCGYRSSFVSKCPGCKEGRLEAYGLGTQKVEHELNRLFPTARVLRLDGDVTAKRGAYQAVLHQFTNGEADILVGTQMVSKGLDIPKVTLAGVLAADAAFNLPDYRSCERGFQLLMQVAGRAGRGHAPGKVILQTYTPELPMLKLAQQHDYETFANTELLSRKELEYPPYSQLTRVVVSGAELIEVQAFCERLAEDLSKFLDEERQARIKILGPAPCLLERVKEKYRYHVLIKNMMGEAGRKLVASFLQARKAERELIMAVDVDAVDLL
jgi:primosomal protein N' (replication factor Y) (superfamily II helicase)